MSQLFTGNQYLATAQVGATILQMCSIQQIYQNNGVSLFVRDYVGTSVPTNCPDYELYVEGRLQKMIYDFEHIENVGIEKFLTSAKRFFKREIN